MEEINPLETRWISPVTSICCRYVESGDQTDILREGYWASYNVPFYEDIYYRSGYAAAEQKTGANVYQLGPRAAW